MFRSKTTLELSLDKVFKLCEPHTRMVRSSVMSRRVMLYGCFLGWLRLSYLEMSLSRSWISFHFSAVLVSLGCLWVS